MNLRKIIYVSGTRADYGLIRTLLNKLNTADNIDLSLCVTGMHLSSLYGNTIKEIEADKFRICGVIPVDVNNTTNASMAKSIGHEIIGFTEIFEKEQPNIILLLGDRGEMLAAAIAAVHLNIPIVHIHGGERSGTVDEMVRHAISKLSHYHFVATKKSEERLIKMGEKEEMISVVGAPGLDEILAHNPVKKDIFLEKYKLDSTKITALLIYHPIVQEYNEIQQQISNLLQASLDSQLQIICIEPNSDAGGLLIRKELQRYKNHNQVRIINHLVRADFIDCLANVDVMLGNSSSAIIEAASFNLIAVNIGNRQNLRECSSNIINVTTSYNAILDGIKMSLQIPKNKFKNIYGDGNASENCYQLLKTINLDSKILNKCNVY